MSTLISSYIPQIMSTLLSDAIMMIEFKGNQPYYFKDTKGEVYLILRIGKQIDGIKKHPLCPDLEAEGNHHSFGGPDSSTLNNTQDEIDIINAKKILIGQLRSIKIVPHSGRNNNEVIINNSYIVSINNSGFDFLYYLFWLKINFPDKKDYLKIEEEIPEEHIKKLLPGSNYKKLNRFNYTWVNPNNKNSSSERDTQQSRVNSNFKKNGGITFNVIVKGKGNHYIPNEISNDKIELICYSEMM
ncbi:MAG: hypothetical protein H8E85_00600 [Candidatus Marinimicrobia bacterium]|nr:hypothetical protein [Candidatus Neomarinimicrobiota bacterium]